MSFKNLTKLIISLLVCQLAGFAGSLFTTPSIPGWYAQLNKPSFNPPNWIFSPVWISLFVLMGLCLFLLWSHKPVLQVAKIALSWFFIQLVLNILWSLLFFGFKVPLVAFVEIIFLWIAILITMMKVMKVSKPAGFLLLPYLLWVSFASILNFFLWKLNF